MYKVMGRFGNHRYTVEIECVCWGVVECRCRVYGRVWLSGLGKFNIGGFRWL